MDPNDLIDSIVDAIDYAEIAHDAQGLVKARRLLNNDLRQAIDLYVQDEVIRAVARTARREREGAASYGSANSNGVAHGAAAPKEGRRYASHTG
jgi:hypothetical protein